jgi:hypothetical protein
MTAVSTEIINDYIVTAVSETVTMSRTVTIEKGTFALYVKGGVLDRSFLVSYPDLGEGSILDLGLAMPNSVVYYFEDPSWFNVTNGNFYTYHINEFENYQAYYVGIRLG